MLVVSYNPLLVGAAVLLALMAAFTGLSLTNGLSRLSSRERKPMIVRSAIVIGGETERAVGHLRLPGALVETIYNGIDTDRFIVDRSEVPDTKADLGIPEETPLIITVAVLRPPKGIDVMLQAMPDIPDAHYLVVGDGDARSTLEAEAARLGLGDRVTFAGARADIPVMLATADLFVLPSLTEALPTVIAEAMAAGLPVVATDVGGTIEMVDQHTGIVVDAGDADQLATAISSLLSDPARSSAMGQAGREVAAERFDINGQSARLIAEYRRLVPARRR